VAKDPFAKWYVDSPVDSSSDPFSQWYVSEPEEIPQEKPKRSLGKEALRQVGRLGRSGATGIAGLADIPNLAALGLHAVGLKKEPLFYEPIAGRVEKAITPPLERAIGENLSPENKIEEYGDIITEGLAPLALAPLTGGASLTGVAAKGLASRGGTGLATKLAQKVSKLGSKPYELTASNIAGNVGSSAAVKSYLDEGGDPNLIGPLMAGMAGGVGARAALKLKNPLNAAAEGVGRLTGFSPEKYAQNVELGLPVSVATVSKSNLPGYLEMIAAKMPGSMGPLEDFYKNREAAIARNLGISTPENLEHAVRNPAKHLAKEGAEGYHGRAEKIYKRREEKFKPREEEAIKNKELVDVHDLIQKLEDRRSLSLTPKAQKRFDKSKDGILLKELKESIPNNSFIDVADSLRKQGYSHEAIETIMNAVGKETPTSTPGIGLHDLNELREKALHQSIKEQTPLGGGTPESRKAAMRSQILAGKRHEFMEQIGTPKEIHNAREARKFWAKYKNEQDGMSHYVEKITGSMDDAEAFKKLTSSNPKYLNVVRQGLPKDARGKLVESIISDLGERQGRFNINTAYTAFSNLEEPVKQQFLKTFTTKDAAKNFEKTMKFIGENKKMMENLANTSGTAHSNHIIDLMKRYGAAATAAATGYTVLPLVGLLATYGGLKGGAKVWTNQNFLKRMNDTITAKNLKAQTNHLDLLFKSINQVGRNTEVHKKKE
jgi:hypothetical protein